MCFQVKENFCLQCNNEYKSNDLLLNHMTQQNHYSLPSQYIWDCPRSAGSYHFEHK